MRALSLYATLVGFLFALIIALAAAPVLVIATVALAGVFLGSAVCLSLYHLTIWILS